MVVIDFIANLINYYYPISDFVKAALISYLRDKKFSERDYNKLYAWLLKNHSRKWKTTPDIAIIEEAEKAINDYAYNFGTPKDKLEYDKKLLSSSELTDKDSEQEEDFSEKIILTFDELKKKFNTKNNAKI